MQESLAILMLLGGFVASCFTIHTVVKQDEALRAFPAIAATVDSSDVQIAHTFEHMSFYTPAIRYTYLVGPDAYTATETFPVDNSGSRGWARSVASQFPADAHVTAYVDPTDPTHAFLVHDYLLAPYLYAIASLLTFCGGIVFFSSAVTLWRAQTKTISLEPEWFLLLPTVYLRESFRKALFFFISFILITGLFLGHYLAGVHDKGDGVLLFVASAVTAAILLYYTVNRWTLSRHIDDARVTVSPYPMQRTGPFRIKCELDARTTLHVHSMRASIRCVEEYTEYVGTRATKKTRTLAYQSATLVTAETPRTLLPRETLAAETTFSFDDETLPTSSPDLDTPSSITWRLRLHVDFENHPTYHATFPLRVA